MWPFNLFKRKNTEPEVQLEQQVAQLNQPAEQSKQQSNESKELDLECVAMVAVAAIDTAAHVAATSTTNDGTPSGRDNVHSVDAYSSIDHYAEPQSDLPDSIPSSGTDSVGLLGGLPDVSDLTGLFD